jgi:hypothetical protein
MQPLVASRQASTSARSVAEELLSRNQNRPRHPSAEAPVSSAPRVTPAWDGFDAHGIGIEGLRVPSHECITFLKSATEVGPVSARRRGCQNAESGRAPGGAEGSGFGLYFILVSSSGGAQDTPIHKSRANLGNGTLRFAGIRADNAAPLPTMSRVSQYRYTAVHNCRYIANACRITSGWSVIRQSAPMPTSARASSGSLTVQTDSA